MWQQLDYWLLALSRVTPASPLHGPCRRTRATTQNWAGAATPAQPCHQLLPRTERRTTWCILTALNAPTSYGSPVGRPLHRGQPHRQRLRMENCLSGMLNGRIEPQLMSGEQHARQ